MERVKVNILDIPTRSTRPVFSPKRKDFVSDYKKYAEEVAEHIQFLTWDDIVASYKEEERCYLKLVFNFAIIEATSSNNLEEYKELRKYFLASTTTLQARDLAIEVETIIDGSSVVFEVSTRNNYADWSGVRKKCKLDLKTILRRFRKGERGRKFYGDLFLFIEYNFLESEDFNRIEEKKYPNFYESC